MRKRVVKIIMLLVLVAHVFLLGDNFSINILESDSLYVQFEQEQNAESEETAPEEGPVAKRKEVSPAITELTLTTSQEWLDDENITLSSGAVVQNVSSTSKEACESMISSGHEYYKFSKVTFSSMFTNKVNHHKGLVAACMFDLPDTFSGHFPHQMQRLYPCWSYWISRRPEKPVLVDKTGIFERAAFQSEFFQGMYKVLKRELKVEVVRKNDSLVAGETIVYPRKKSGWEGDHLHWFAAPQHAHDLRDAVLKHHRIRPTTCNTTHKVRFGILNRFGARQFVNANDLVGLLEPHVSSITVVNFNDTSFGKQIHFFSSIDVLVSPHGAQLTGLPFMPNCGALIEIFPKGYYIPGFFGALASNSGLLYSNLYLSL